MKDLYNPEFIASLFDNMSKTYKKVNYITSFGFSDRWGKQCVRAAEIKKGDIVVDLMTGMGECWPFIIKNAGATSQMIALDISTEMIRMADEKMKQKRHENIQLLRENVFENSLENNSVDVVISGFGLKTFNKEQLGMLAKEIKRVLKPSGRFSLVDVSVPNNVTLKLIYLFYIKQCIPLLGKLFLGNPETYKMLGIYTDRFKNAKEVTQIFKENGLNTSFESYFFGCATGVVGENKSFT